MASQREVLSLLREKMQELVQEARSRAEMESRALSSKSAKKNEKEFERIRQLVEKRQYARAFRKLDVKIVTVYDNGYGSRMMRFDVTLPPVPGVDTSAVREKWKAFETEATKQYRELEFQVMLSGLKKGGANDELVEQVKKFLLLRVPETMPQLESGEKPAVPAEVV